MTAYCIRIFDGGVWNGEMPYHCEAANALEAAEIVFGGKLIETGRLSELSAEVWEEHQPRRRTPFYAPLPASAAIAEPVAEPGGAGPIANDNRHARRGAARPSPTAKDLR